VLSCCAAKAQAPCGHCGCELAGLVSDTFQIWDPGTSFTSIGVQDKVCLGGALHQMSQLGHARQGLHLRVVKLRTKLYTVIIISVQ